MHILRVYIDACNENLHIDSYQFTVKEMRSNLLDDSDWPVL